MYGNRFIDNYRCFGNGFFLNGWSFFIAIGVILIITAIIIFYLRKGSLQNTNHEILEILKTKFAQGEISEDEYLRRKDTIDRK